MSAIIVILYSYLLGSIPFGYVLVRLFYGQDVRTTGSGNIGATNVSRTSPLLGVTTLVLDACKGAAAVFLTRSFFPGQASLLGLAALMAIIGHMLPCWLKFRGGKGVATGLGSFAVLFPKTILLMIAVFVLIFGAFRYVSLASLLTVALFPALLIAINSIDVVRPVLCYAIASSFLIVIKHHENIRRLLNHSEPRFRERRK
jgi:glycerol-3-phosphate acyltransferase PlsY